MFIALKTEIENRNQLRNYLEENKNINTLHIINGGFDFHAETVFKNQKQAQDFLDDLQIKNNITEINTYNIIDTVHSEKFLTKEEHFE